MRREDTIATAAFVMAGERTSLELHRYPDDRFSMTGTYQGGFGQCGERIRDDADDFPEVLAALDLWDAHHLKVADDAVFGEAVAALAALNGQRLGDAPDIYDAPDLSGDILDSRDVIKALEIYREAILHMGVPENVTLADAPEDLDDEDMRIVEEFIRLREFDRAGSDYAPDWSFGATIIEDSAFVAYCEDELKDTGTISSDLPDWVAIDWEKTAAAMRRDYTEITYGDREFLVR